MWLSALALWLSVTAGEGRAGAVEEVVKRVQARYDATADFTADVVQEATIVSLDRTVRASGTVVFRKPGRMRWNLTEGDPQVIVADGTTLWVYRPDDEQVIKMPFRAAFRSTTPISFLTGVGRLADDFEATLEGGDERTLGLLLRPRRQGEDVGRLRLVVDRESHDILGAEVTDPLGNRSRVTFSQLRRNTGVGEETFVFQVPPGVDVVSAPEP